jgi:hypothetical protein
MITSNSLAKEIADRAHEAGFSVAVYTGSDLEICYDGLTMYETKNRDLADVATHWKKNLLIFTSSITAGVNYSEKHFHRFIHCFVMNTCDAPAFVQGTGRVRHFSEKEHTIYYQEYVTDPPRSPYDIVYSNDG